MLKELIAKTRSYRRFHEDQPISKENLLELIDYGRLSASGGNKQPLRYYVVHEKEVNDKVYPTLGWAGYLSDWPGPEAGERPSAYIVMLQDKKDKMVGGIDHGIAAQSILLGAMETGLGGCIIATVRKADLQQALNIPDNFDILIVIALGKPKEQVVIEEIDAEGDIKYYRDQEQIHHVPKRKLKDIVINY